ncbi:hypothetical protein ABBQ38_007908 [Trebouxia sp. C0009 RCD-2024]
MYNASPDELGQHANGVHEYYLEIASAQKGGSRPVDKRVEAPMYAAMVEEDGHPLVYASLLNHASYFFGAPMAVSKEGTGDEHSESQQQWAKLTELKNTVSSIDLIERHPGSAVWAPYHSEQGIVIVSKENPATKWVSYDGYFGVPLGKPSFTHATETWGGKLPPLAVMSTAIIGKIAESTVHCRACNPTLGLGARHHLRHPHVSNWKHIQVSSASGLVLSANPADISAPLILAPVQDHNPHQLWYQDHWRQFGNPGANSDHVNKEAFVLINKATMKLIACRTDEHHLRLIEYGRGKGGDATRECVVLEEEDNNAVVYGQNGSAWSTKTNNKGVSPARFVMQADGNLVIYDGHNKVLWASGTRR